MLRRTGFDTCHAPGLSWAFKAARGSRLTPQLEEGRITCRWACQPCEYEGPGITRSMCRLPDAPSFPAPAVIAVPSDQIEQTHKQSTRG
ncbi:hypothetical protein ACCO45_007140 [Purpureocillium lilacinum]|uniref:Uncharacterized protein n=1 Tax=Purpureocillium lilacinum TaxID=33203 RepID=A0ACC4DSA6_PURLI